MELRDMNCVFKSRFNHYKRCAEIASRRITELEARIAELNDVMLAVPVVIQPVAPVAIQPVVIQPAVTDTLPRGYYFEGATTTVNNVSFRVVRGPNLGFHTLRSPLVLKRLSASQFSRMVQEE